MGIFFTLLFRRNLYTIINPQQTRRCFQGTFQRLDFRHCRFEHARLTIINHLAIDQIETVKHEAAFGIGQGCVLGCIVICSKFGDKIGRVLGSVDGESFGNGQ